MDNGRVNNGTLITKSSYRADMEMTREPSTSKCNAPNDKKPGYGVAIRGVRMTRGLAPGGAFPRRCDETAKGPTGKS